jgi:ribosomal protein S19E (S16A)
MVCSSKDTSKKVKGNPQITRKKIKEIEKKCWLDKRTEDQRRTKPKLAKFFQQIKKG